MTYLKTDFNVTIMTLVTDFNEHISGSITNLRKEQSSLYHGETRLFLLIAQLVEGLTRLTELT